MDIFEYLPQLIVAYDGNDEFASLIHVKKAENGKDYYCPCCQQIVRPRAKDSVKEQAHYYHLNGMCPQKSQVHFFYKNWLFNVGSKFYLGETLYEVKSIDIEKTWNTSFGDYRPDITVYTTSNQIIYFELFFSNRKTGDNYFCKWDELGNDVVEINIKEYMNKTDKDDIPTFNYLYHNGECYSKEYKSRDLYATTISARKKQLTRQQLLDYKARIEQLDWFWQAVINNEPDNIKKNIESMNYDDQVFCYGVIKKKNCVSYLKNDVLKIINEGIINIIRKQLNLPVNKNIYFDIVNLYGRTYEYGIVLNFESKHIHYHGIYEHLDTWKYVVFKKNIHTAEEIKISKKDASKLERIYNNTLKTYEEFAKLEQKITDFEKNKYKISLNNNIYTVLIKSDNKFEKLFELEQSDIFNLSILNHAIEDKIKENQGNEYIKQILSNEHYMNMIQKLKDDSRIDFDFRIKLNESFNVMVKVELGTKCIYEDYYNNDFEDHFIKINNEVLSYSNAYKNILDCVDRINHCKNKLWSARFNCPSYCYPQSSFSMTINCNLNDFDKQCQANAMTFKVDKWTSFEDICEEARKNMERTLSYFGYDGCYVIWEGGNNQ